MRERGYARASQSVRSRWRERFGGMVEQILDARPRAVLPRIIVTPVHDRVHANLGARTLLVPVRVHNQGTHAACAEGPARVAVSCTVDGNQTLTHLPGLLLPAQRQALAVMTVVPTEPGEYPLRISVERQQGTAGTGELASCSLVVGCAGTATCATPFLEAAHEALVNVEDRRTLPDDYLDVTEGWFAHWKRWLKGKLVGNLKRGYIDVLSRQQSQVNRHLAAALQQLTECCATLDHALGGLQKRLDRLEEHLGHHQGPPGGQLNAPARAGRRRSGS
jgi:hypothetical protein